jgi:hypothetical protein
MGPSKRPVEERFWSKVDRSASDGCWLWTGCSANGYGKLQVDGKAVSVHRIAYEFQIGPIPHGRFVCHQCDTKLCVRGSHLYAGTHATNMADMKVKGRAARGDHHSSRTHPERVARGDRNGSIKHRDRLPRGADHWSHRRPEFIVRGEAHGRAKLTEADVRAIRVLHHVGVTCRQLGAMFGVTDVMAGNVAHGRNWKHIE